MIWEFRGYSTQSIWGLQFGNFGVLVLVLFTALIHGIGCSMAPDSRGAVRIATASYLYSTLCPLTIIHRSQALSRLLSHLPEPWMRAENRCLE